MDLTTGTTSLGSGVECGFEDTEVFCHCGLCSLDVGLSCNSNGDCAPDKGVCQKQGAFSPQPHACGESACLDVGAGEGRCEPALIEQGCDGIVRANGEMLLACTSNVDCAEATIGVAAGNCTLSSARECFLETVTATGTPSQTDPVVVSTFCIPLTAGAGFNAVMGLPGPGRSKLATSVALRCAGDPAFTYPGCP
jgi:hypothetical protein